MTRPIQLRRAVEVEDNEGYCEHGFLGAIGCPSCPQPEPQPPKTFTQADFVNSRHPPTGKGAVT